MKSVVFTFIALSVVVSVGALAQETPGVKAPESDKAAVRKNRAPVAKELLKVHFPRPKEYNLPNGLKIYILEDHRVPGTTITLMLKSGSLYWPEPVAAEAAGALLQEGTTTKTSKEISKIVDGMGAELTTGAGQDYATVGISALSDFTEPMLDIVADVALHPTFPQERLENYKYRRISALPSRKSDPESLSRSLANRVNYGTTRYAHPTAKKEEIEAVTRESLFAWHKAALSPDLATLTVVGDVDQKAVVERITGLLGDWKASNGISKEPPADFVAKTATEVHIIDRPGSKQTMLRFTNIGIARNDPDYIPLTVANRILGGGSTSRLFHKIREEKAFTYGAYSDLSAPRYPGTWGAYASVRTEVTGPAVEAFLGEFKRIQEELVGADELDRAKRTLVGGFARTLESPDNILGKYTDLVRNNLPLDYWETFPARIQAVTAEDVQRVARKYLGENHIQITAVGERSSIEPALKQYGPVILYDTDIQPISGPAEAAK